MKMQRKCLHQMKQKKEAYIINKNSAKVANNANDSENKTSRTQDRQERTFVVPIDRTTGLPSMGNWLLTYS